MIESEEIEKIEECGYRLVGKHKHSAIKICRWTKKSILGESICYKQKFYEKIHGIKSHRCLQITPSLPFCDNRCEFCWRNVKHNIPRWDGPVDEPSTIIEEAIEEQRLLLSGFKGNPNADKEKWKEAQNPNLAAISLDGEPTLYPKLDTLIEECQKRKISPFLVTNGQHPENLEKIRDPAQLYISTVAPDKKTYIKTCNPMTPQPWEKLNESLELMQSFESINVLRLTLVKGLNLKNPSGYARLIEKAKPNFVEPKGYVAVGHSRARLGMKYMPTYSEIKEFAKKIADITGYRITDGFEPSRVVLLESGF